MRWLRRWLVGKDDAPVEGDLTSFKTPSCNAPVAAGSRGFSGNIGISIEPEASQRVG